ncbi:MAG: Mdm33 family-domain-containing protein, partial [Olpidium bornovanus]
LYRREHGDEQSEKVAAEEHRAAEQAVERAREAYVEAIRERYHEEQSWSDRVRGAATYGTWALMGVNVLLFLLVQTVFEPRKRDKLVARFEATLDRRTLEERAIVGKQLKLAVEDAAAKNGARVDDVLRSFSVEATALLDSLVKEREAMGHTAEEASALAEMDLYDGRRLAGGSIMPSALPPSSAPETTYEEPRAVAERCFAGNAHPPKSPDDIAREAVSAERNRIAGLWPPTSGWSHFIRSVCSAASIAAESPRQLTNKELILVGAQSALFGCLVTGLATAIFGR